MATNPVENLRRTLTGQTFTAIIGWLDSLDAFHWIKCGNKYKQFVSNQVARNKEMDQIQERHVPTSENRADIAKRGWSPSKLEDN